MFGTAAAAQQLHGILPHLHNAIGHGGDAQGILELLDGQFDALAEASSTRNAALDQLSDATTQQYSVIKADLTNLLAATPSKNSGTRPNGRWEAYALHMAAESAPVTAAATATTRRTPTSTSQPAQVLLAW